jgi:hypothetical protein
MRLLLDTCHSRQPPDCDPGEGLTGNPESLPREDVALDSRSAALRPSGMTFATYDVSSRWEKSQGAASRSRAAAASGVRSRCGEPSISKPTMNFLIVAERRSGG